MAFNKRELFTHKLVFKLRYSFVAENYYYELIVLYTRFALKQCVHYTHKALALCSALRELWYLNSNSVTKLFIYSDLFFHLLSSLLMVNILLCFIFFSDKGLVFSIYIFKKPYNSKRQKKKKTSKGFEHFSKKDGQMVNIHMKRCSVLLA